MTELALSHGELVRKDEVAVSSFLNQVIAKSGKNSRFIGTFDELEALVTEHFDNFEPGEGSVDADVRLVRLPTAGFFTTIVPITSENAGSIRVRWEARVEGEAPVPKLTVLSAENPKASVVKIVIYRADVLAKSSGRSSEAEWEIVAILAQPEERVPMHPTTMARNTLELPGGTKRDYTPEQWAEAELFWQRHAYVENPEEEA